MQKLCFWVVKAWFLPPNLYAFALEMLKNRNDKAILGIFQKCASRYLHFKVVFSVLLLFLGSSDTSCAIVRNIEFSFLSMEYRRIAFVKSEKCVRKQPMLYII